jgi:hypothetical protein
VHFYRLPVCQSRILSFPSSETVTRTYLATFSQKTRIATTLQCGRSGLWLRLGSKLIDTNAQNLEGISSAQEFVTGTMDM